MEWKKNWTKTEILNHFLCGFKISALEILYLEKVFVKNILIPAKFKHIMSTSIIDNQIDLFLT